MQGLGRRLLVIPYTLANYLAGTSLPKSGVDHDAFKDASQSVQERINRVLGVKGDRTARELHRELGRVLWDHVGMSRNEAGLRTALARIPQLREEFWARVSVPGDPHNVNKNLEYAAASPTTWSSPSCWRRRARTTGVVRWALPRGEPDAGQRSDARRRALCLRSGVGVAGVGKTPVLHKEPLSFDYVKPTQRSYK